MQPILSVITITYNNLSGLTKTLALFTENNFIGVENIIVDGGSTDNTKAYLLEHNDSFRWVSEKDKGIYDAMNKGLQMAKGQYVWFLNAGDYAYNKEVVELLLNKLKTNPDVLYGETMLVDESGRELGTRSKLTTRKLPEQLNWKSMQRGMVVSHQSIIVRTEISPFYDLQYKHVADIDWMIRALKASKLIINIHQILSCFTLDGYSTKHRKASNIERFRVLSRHFGACKNLYNHVIIVFRGLFVNKK